MPKEKRPRDPNQFAKFIVDLATDEKNLSVPVDEMTREQLIAELNESREKIKEFQKILAERKSKAVHAGNKGGQIRATKLSSQKRKEIAQKGAAKRWGK